MPTTIAFNPSRYSTYFPVLPEVLMALGYIALAVAAFGVVVKYFAVLPASNEEWNYMFRLAGRRPPAEP